MDSAAEVLPKWSSKPDPSVKGHGGVGASKGVSARVFGIRLTVKDYTTWHSRVSKLIFFCLLLGAGAILGVFTTLNAVGYLSNTESGFLISTSITSLPPHLEVQSDDAASNPSEQPFPTAGAETPILSTNSSLSDYASEYAPSFSQQFEEINSVSQQLEEINESSEDAEIRSWNLSEDVETLVATNSTLMADDASFEDKKELPSSNHLSEFSLMPFPVDLSTLSDVYHEMSDAELLWRASAGAIRRPRSASVTPKVAYMFLTRGPLPLAPLWERYFKGHGGLYSIYLHAHPNYRPNFPTDSVFYRRNIPSKEVFWGKFSVFAAERRLLANALLDPANERFVLLSESCIPITPLPVAYKYFMESKHSFVESYINMGRGGIGRYNRIKRRQKLNPEISAKQWRKGSQWFEMSRDLAIMVVTDRKYYPKYENVLCMKDCICYIDEHYLATVLTILAPTKIANRTTHYIDFHRSTAHPYQWEPAVITEKALKKITTGNNCTYNGKATQTCHMFSRKFSPSTIEPLLKLAATSFGIPE